MPRLALPNGSCDVAVQERSPLRFAPCRSEGRRRLALRRRTGSCWPPARPGLTGRGGSLAWKRHRQISWQPGPPPSTCGGPLSG